MMKWLIILLITLICNVHSAKILAVFPVPTGSHYILGSTLMNALAEKGHEVTFISPYENKNPPKNGTYRDIILTGLVEKQSEIRKQINIFDRGDSHPLISALISARFMLELCEFTLNHTNVQALIHSNETFDVVIIEQFINDALKGLAAHYNAPLIIFSTIGACNWVNVLIGNPSPLSYAPELLLRYSSDMSFFQRFFNGFMYLFFNLVNAVYLFPKQEEMLNKHFPNPRNFYDILYNSSLVFLNSHSSINQPVPIVPSMIEIGGFHIKPPKKLPKDLQEFLDSAKDGVIYFSMGSNLRSTQLPLEKRDAFLKAFAKLKQKVLWKWEDDELPGKPENVKIVKWLPQQDVLAHPNIKLFITHGGLLSTIETIYHGVPILAIPIYGDQGTNAARAVHDGYGLVLPFPQITEENLSEKIGEILQDSNYRETAQFRSKIFHDQEVKPLDKAIYWVEYILRHGRADHLKVAGLKLPWYKYHLLDVIAFTFLIIVTINIILFLIIKKLCLRIRKEKLKKN